MFEFGETQKKIIVAGLTVLSAAALFAVGWAVFRFLAFASPALVPVALGAFLALLFRPYYEWLRARLRNPALAIAALFVSVFVPVCALLWFGGAFITAQAAALVTAAPDVAVRFSSWCAERFPGAPAFLASVGAPDEFALFFTDPASFVRALAAQYAAVSGAFALQFGVGALKGLSILGTFLLTLVFAVFFLLKSRPISGEDCAAELPFLAPRTRAFAAHAVDTFLSIVVSFFRRQVLICLLEGVLYGLGFQLVGLSYGFILGFALGVLNLVPFFGSLVVLPFALPLAYFGDGGSALRLVAVAAVWASVLAADNYFITPKIQGDATGLGFGGVIFSFVFWGTVFRSFLGLLLAIPLSACCLVLWRAVKAHFREAEAPVVGGSAK